MYIFAARHMPIDQLRIDNWTEKEGNTSKYVPVLARPTWASA